MHSVFCPLFAGCIQFLPLTERNFQFVRSRSPLTIRVIQFSRCRLLRFPWGNKEVRIIYDHFKFFCLYWKLLFLPNFRSPLSRHSGRSVAVRVTSSQTNEDKHESFKPIYQTTSDVQMTSLCNVKLFNLSDLTICFSIFWWLTFVDQSR